jgi:hypothetical protein
MRLNKHYVRGYLGMLEKCAQFTRNPNAGKMYYAVSAEDQKKLDRRMGNIEAAQKKYDSMSGWNPLNWIPMMSAAYQEGHNKRELEREKKRVAAHTAYNAVPVNEYQMRQLQRYNGTKFLGVNAADSQNYESTRDSLANGLNDYGVLRDMTSSVREARRAYGNSAAGQQAAINRQNSAAMRHAIANSFVFGGPLAPAVGMLTYQTQKAPQPRNLGSGQYASQQRGYS